MDGPRGGVGGQSLLLTRSGGARSGLGKISPLFCSQLFSGGGDDDIYTSLLGSESELGGGTMEGEKKEGKYFDLDFSTCGDDSDEQQKFC